MGATGLESWNRRRWQVFWWCALALATWLIAWAVFFPDLLNPGIEEVPSEERVAARTDFRRVLVQALLGIGAFVGAVYIARRFNLSSSEHALERDKTTTSDYTKAVGQLASDRTGERLGGIYALGRIAQDSHRDHWAIMQVLTGWLRDESPTGGIRAADQQKKPANMPREDFKAVSDVLGKRNAEWDEFPLNLSECDLRVAWLSGSSFTEANLYQADLRRAYFRDADLRGAFLMGADLSEAKLDGARLEGAWYSPSTEWPDGFDPQVAGCELRPGHA